jgi:hypothetical protein
MFDRSCSWRASDVGYRPAKPFAKFGVQIEVQQKQVVDAMRDAFGPRHGVLDAGVSVVFLLTAHGINLLGLYSTKGCTRHNNALAQAQHSVITLDKHCEQTCVMVVDALSTKGLRQQTGRRVMPFVEKSLGVFSQRLDLACDVRWEWIVQEKTLLVLIGHMSLNPIQQADRGSTRHEKKCAGVQVMPMSLFEYLGFDIPGEGLLPCAA